jgi:mannose-6-phosphate isomerase-like protein (cupin superfamily)
MARSPGARAKLARRRRERFSPSRPVAGLDTPGAAALCSLAMPGPEPSPATIVISELATGPTPPHAARTTWPNVLHTRLAAVVTQMGPAPWSRRIIADERQLVTLIASPPGGGNRPHWHREFDEWWVVLAGRLEWELTGGSVVQATKDDIVWVPRGTVHHIRNVGEELSLRLAVAMPPAMHYFSPCEQCGYADDGPREWCA